MNSADRYEPDAEKPVRLRDLIAIIGAVIYVGWHALRRT
jgi:hypothetical protein